LPRHVSGVLRIGTSQSTNKSAGRMEAQGSEQRSAHSYSAARKQKQESKPDSSSLTSLLENLEELESSVAKQIKRSNNNGVMYVFEFVTNHIFSD